MAVQIDGSQGSVIATSGDYSGGVSIGGGGGGGRRVSTGGGGGGDLICWFGI